MINTWFGCIVCLPDGFGAIELPFFQELVLYSRTGGRGLLRMTCLLQTVLRLLSDTCPDRIPPHRVAVFHLAALDRTRALITSSLTAAITSQYLFPKLVDNDGQRLVWSPAGAVYLYLTVQLSRIYRLDYMVRCPIHASFGCQALCAKFLLREVGLAIIAKTHHEQSAFASALPPCPSLSDFPPGVPPTSGWAMRCAVAGPLSPPTTSVVSDSVVPPDAAAARPASRRRDRTKAHSVQVLSIPSEQPAVPPGVVNPYAITVLPSSLLSRTPVPRGLPLTPPATSHPSTPAMGTSSLLTRTRLRFTRRRKSVAVRSEEPIYQEMYPPNPNDKTTKL